ncbi:TonB-dependent receptor [Aquabacterium sp. A7-Y]|uniref:TonB-dependent receptor domain-containing protein n=1 Tax=Aquabacterium sp. A7-Y TaxID=1349605 RepID=UPI00223E238E|nr:TonB-dependent receptor [Aquabacterium sp. A7-Y]MCW7538632.1 TonB-dependent receptor [Aquabacterium sp. A7-Y]
MSRAISADPVSESFAERYRGFSPKLGLRWDWRPELQVYANLSRSFEPTSFGELTGGLRPTINEAQRATILELGSRGRMAQLEWDVSLFEAHLHDELLQIATNTAGANVTVNAARSVHRGLELGLSGKALASEAGRLEWRLQGLWNDFHLKGDPSYGSRRLPGVPRHAARAQLGWRFEGGSLLALHAEGAGGYPIDFANSFRAPGYAVWGLKASGEFQPGLGWFVDGRNLADRRYVATTGVVRDARGRDTAQFLPGDGRSVYAGIDWKFN